MQQLAAIFETTGEGILKQFSFRFTFLPNRGLDAAAEAGPEQAP
jgi:hypothetical protein